MRAYIFLVLTSQAQAGSSIFGNLASAMDAQKVFNNKFKVIINEDYSIGIDIERYHCVLGHALSKADFSVGIGTHASKQYKLMHWKDEGIQKQNFSEENRYENWFK